MIKRGGSKKEENNIKEYYKSLSTFCLESNKFKEGVNYLLKDVIDEGIFKLYTFIELDDYKIPVSGELLMFGDYDSTFSSFFINLKDDRIRNINKLLYES
jgi:hypothetical protein